MPDELRSWPEHADGEVVCGRCAAPASATGRDYGTQAGPVDPRLRDTYRCTDRRCPWSRPPR